MAYQKFRNGFDVSTNSAIDKRMYLTKAEMLTAHEDFNLPDVYINICPTDGKLYVYSKDNEIDENLGKFRQLEDSLNFTTSEEATQVIADAVNEAIAKDTSEIVQTIQDGLNHIDGGDI